MTIPVIAPYSMPAESELPANLVEWRADSARAVLLIHDMQRYFVSFFAPGRPLTQLIRNIRELRETSARLNVPIVYTAQPGDMTPDQRGLLQDFWGAGMTGDPREKEIIRELAPGDGDTVLTKWRYSAFHGSGLKQFMDGHSRDQLVICGVYAHIGCMLTACDSFALDLEPFLVADALLDFSSEEHRMALEYSAKRCASVVSTSSVVEMLSCRRARVC